MNKIERIKELTRRLNYYRDEYYNNSKSIILDKEYDTLFDELQKLENETNFHLSNSPCRTVGYEVKSELTKVKHSHPMLSLDKTKNIKDLIKFAENQDCIFSCKLDGLSILLTYDNGELIKAETRGNGEIGEDITHNAKVFDNIPLTIPNKHHIEFEGEAIITYKDFGIINSSLPDDKKYKNPRNLVSGSVRQLDSNIAKNRHIKFIVWKIPKGFTHYSEGFNFAKKLGFDVVPFFTYSNNSSDKENIEKIIEELKSKALKLSLPLDGLVLTYDNIEYGKSLGVTGHHPKHSLAYKFYDDEYETTLKDIEWTIGKTGILTPTAIFEPIEIDGTEIERASLHNISVMYKTMNGEAYVGETVYVVKMNQIIPQIIRSESTCPNNAKFIHIPNTCPVCGSKTEIIKDNNSKVLMCTNKNCKGILLKKLSHFVSKNAINIDGLSEQTLQFLINKGWVKSFKDLYDLNYSPWINEWKSTNGFGEKSVNKLLENIEKSRNTTLDRFIYSLSIPQVGRSTSKDIVKLFNNDYENFRTYGMTTNYEQVDGIGETVNKSIHEWLNINHTEMNLLASEFIFESSNNLNTSSNVNLSNKTFVVTGSLNHYKNRNELVQIIESLGGKVSGSTSSKTNYLINNDNTSSSSKNKKAKELGIPIITEEEFINMIS